ncbi:MAG: hypothetical protein ABH821_01625 [archaeon]
MAENEKKLQAIEKNIKPLLEKYGLSESRIESDLSRMDKTRLFEDFEKLLDIVELEQKSINLLKKEKQVKVEGKVFKPSTQDKKQAELVVKEFKKHSIVTDFDKILNLVKENQSIKSKKLMALTNLTKKQLDNCLDILEENELVEVYYPPVGDVLVRIAGYKKKLKEEKKKLKQLKKEQKKQSKNKKTVKEPEVKPKEKKKLFGFMRKKK